MRKFDLATIVPLNGNTSRLGEGVEKSIRFMLDRRNPELSKAGIELQLRTYNDEGNPELAIEKAKMAIKAGCSCFIGPCDSSCVEGVLRSGAVQSHAVITPTATATILSELGSPCFFRMTTPDRVRAQEIVDLVKRLYPNQCVRVFFLRDSENSYSQQLKTDCLGALKRSGVNWYPPPTGWCLDETPKLAFSDRAPAIFCAPSSETSRVVELLRRKGMRSQVFTFGSNRNLLTKYLDEAIVVTDLDRDITKQKVLSILENFDTVFTSEIEPSLSAMSATEMIVNLFLRKAGKIVEMADKAVPEFLVESLRNEAQKALFADVVFSEKGESIGGSEDILLKRVQKRLFGFRFAELDEKLRPHLYPRFDSTAVLKAFGVGISLVAAIITIIAAIIAVMSHFSR